MATTEEGIIKLETIFEGSTFYGAELEFLEVLEDDSEIPVDLAGSIIRIDMIREGRVWCSYSNTLQTNDPKYLEIIENKIVFKEHIPSLKTGIYVFDIKVVFANQVVEKGIGRGQWSIRNPLTK